MFIKSLSHTHTHTVTFVAFIYDIAHDDEHVISIRIINYIVVLNTIPLIIRDIENP